MARHTAGHFSHFFSMKFSLLRKKRLRAVAPFLAAFFVAASSQVQAAPNFKNTTARPLHFQPEGHSFVVENGREFFNRPLYGGNTAFRADVGDKPEISFYMPGRGGNLRFGIRVAGGQKWLHEAQNVVARYVPGSMLYEIRDPLLGNGALHLAVQVMNEAEGVVVRLEKRGTTAPVEVVWAYGGANGERHARNGDIGTDRVPMSQYFQLKPDFARGSVFSLQNNGFTLKTPRNDVVGLASGAATWALADATKWASLGDLLASSTSTSPELPVVVGRANLAAGQPFYLGLERLGGGTEATTPTIAASYKSQDLARVFDAAEAHRREIAEKVIVETPDPYINAAVAALCVAADAVWDTREKAFMHGGVAWRNKLLGWRGAYSGDELGYPQRTRDHLMNWFPRQNVKPITTDLVSAKVPGDAAFNFARNEGPLHSNGDLSNSHYDMNMPVIDILFRHFLWTGDLDYAREVWPVIERHLAWERRLFRRPFGPQNLPLYEAYAAIWASDDLQYHGGGATHSTAYNLYHNRMAARMAKLLAQEATPYEREAELISRALKSELWLPQHGWYGEWKDLLGQQKVHPNAALWTFYHTVDSEAATPLEAWQMTRFIDTQIPRIPIHGPNVPAEGLFTLPTTTWMPYTWSTNNVVMGEAAHTSLSYWQSGRDETAFKLFKGLLLDSMYLGLCPGNVGMATYFDMARNESQRDFADGVGTTSRTLIEGLFGVHPDALAGQLTLRPGFPASWNRASLKHANLDFSFVCVGLRDSYSIAPKWAKPMALRLRLAAPRDGIASVTVNGKAVKWRAMDDAVGTPRIEIQSPAAPKFEVVINWKGAAPATATTPAVVAQNSEMRAGSGAAKILQISDPQKALSGLKTGANSLRGLAGGLLGHRTMFAHVKQGEMTWWQPLQFEIRPAYEIIEGENQDSSGLRFAVRNNTRTPLKRNVMLRAGQRVLPISLQVPAMGQSSEISVPSAGLLPGTSAVEIGLNSRQIVRGTVTNWKIAPPPRGGLMWENVDLTTILNDRVSQIFKNEYLTPRSPYVSLAIPKQGIGSWPSWNKVFEVDDSGLRAISAQNGGKITLPQGVPFGTPSAPDARNIAFTSQWDNYPRGVEVPLSGSASHLYLLMAGSTNPMQSRFDNGEVIVTYSDGTTERLALENPTNWWPIEQDYKIDDFAFRRPQQVPPRVDLATGTVRVPDIAAFKGQGGVIPGGAATVLDLPLQTGKTLKSLRVNALANEVIIGLMSATLARP